MEITKKMYQCICMLLGLYVLMCFWVRTAQDLEVVRPFRSAELIPFFESDIYCKNNHGVLKIDIYLFTDQRDNPMICLHRFLSKGIFFIFSYLMHWDAETNVCFSSKADGKSCLYIIIFLL